MRRHDNEQGYTLVIIAALIVVFLGFTALSVDMGILYSARASAQRAADAAALAGAFVFITRGDLSETTTPKQSDVIKENAVKTAATNKMLGATVTITPADVTVDTANHRVTVIVVQSQPTLFARVLGENSANIRAEAIAEAATTATATGCLKPFFIPNTALSADDPCVTCWGNDSTPSTGDDPSPKHVLIENVGGVLEVSDWALTEVRNGNNQFLLKPKDPSQALRPGDFMLIDVPGTTPGDLDEVISICIADPSFCAQTYSILTGNHAGPVKAGVKDLIGCPDPDIYLSAGNYERPDGTVGSTSRSLVTCPIWDVCNAMPNGITPFCPDGSVPGGTQVQLQIVGFALVFVEGFTSGGGGGTPDCNGANAVGRIINLAACGASGGGGIDPAETGPFGVPLRLVRQP